MHARRPRRQAAPSAARCSRDRWTRLKLDGRRAAFARGAPAAARRALRSVAGTPRTSGPGGAAASSIRAASRTSCATSVRFEDIGKHMRAGLLSALSISTTHVASGRTVVFVQRREGGAAALGQRPDDGRPRDARSAAEHVLASAAVPLLFPAVEIEGQFYCDGGLRQNVPLSPARRLGADSLIVVNPRYIREESPTARGRRGARAEVPRPALRLRQGDERAPARSHRERHRPARAPQRRARGGRRGASARTSRDASTASSGGAGASPLRPLDVVYVRASQDIGVLAAEYARSPSSRSAASGSWEG